MPGSLTQAPVPLILTDGSEWQYSPLTDRDYDELDMWARAQIIQSARASLGPETTALERDETMRAALHVAGRIQWHSVSGLVAGFVRVHWTALRKKHPAITPNDVRTMLKDENNIERAEAAYMEVNQLKIKKKNEPSGPGGDREDDPTSLSS